MRREIVSVVSTLDIACHRIQSRSCCDQISYVERVRTHPRGNVGKRYLRVRVRRSLPLPTFIKKEIESHASIIGDTLTRLLEEFGSKWFIRAQIDEVTSFAERHFSANPPSGLIEALRTEANRIFRGSSVHTNSLEEELTRTKRLAHDALIAQLDEFFWGGQWSSKSCGIGESRVSGGFL